jgi:hypothetical protein
LLRLRRLASDQVTVEGGWSQRRIRSSRRASDRQPPAVTRPVIGLHLNIRIRTPAGASTVIPLESSARMITFNAEEIAFCVTAKTSAGSSISAARSRISTASFIRRPCSLAALQRQTSARVRISRRTASARSLTPVTMPCGEVVAASGRAVDPADEVVDPVHGGGDLGPDFEPGSRLVIDPGPRRPGNDRRRPGMRLPIVEEPQ